MYLRSISIVITFLISAPTLWGAIVTVPDIVIAEGTATADFVVTVFGGEQITGVTAAIVQVGDGGPTLDGLASTPQIISVDFSQSIFFNSLTAPGGVDPVTDFSLPPPSAIIDPGKALLSPATDFVVASGELFRFTLDTSSLVAGQLFSVNMDTFGTLGQAATLQQFGGGTITPTFGPTGSISVSSVPEPSGMVLVAAFLAWIGRRYRRQAAAPTMVGSKS
jgi:hypothetical protein